MAFPFPIGTPPTFPSPQRQQPFNLLSLLPLLGLPALGLLGGWKGASLAGGISTGIGEERKRQQDTLERQRQEQVSAAEKQRERDFDRSQQEARLRSARELEELGQHGEESRLTRRERGESLRQQRGEGATKSLAKQRQDFELQQKDLSDPKVDTPAMLRDLYPAPTIRSSELAKILGTLDNPIAFVTMFPAEKRAEALRVLQQYTEATTKGAPTASSDFETFLKIYGEENKGASIKEALAEWRKLPEPKEPKAKPGEALSRGLKDLSTIYKNDPKELQRVLQESGVNPSDLLQGALPEAKTTTMAEVVQYAAEEGITIQEAMKKVKEEGFQIVPTEDASSALPTFRQRMKQPSEFLEMLKRNPQGKRALR